MGHWLRREHAGGKKKETTTFAEQVMAGFSSVAVLATRRRLLVPHPHVKDMCPKALAAFPVPGAPTSLLQGICCVPTKVNA